MTYYTNYIIQSRTTGRFLLRKNKEKWGFAVKVNWDSNVPEPGEDGFIQGVYNNTAALCRDMTTFVSSFDDALITVTHRHYPAGMVDHIWVPNEFAFQDSEWFDFTRFPVECEAGVFKSFNDPHMVRIFCNP